MEFVTCNNCGGDSVDLVNSGRDLQLNRPLFYTLVRCRRCDLIYQNPRPTPAEIGEHYPATYDRFVTDEPQSVTQRLSRHHELSRRRQQVERRAPAPGRLLDVGCATGLFLKTMRDGGWQVAGVELNEYAAAHARNLFDLEVVTGTLEAFSYPPASFDVITMWDVLEHVFDPKQTLAQAAELLKAGGLLVLSTPNPTCFEARLFGSCWIGWERPRHLHLFSPEVLRRYLERAGFEKIDFASRGGRWSVTLTSIAFLLKARGVPEEKWRPWLSRAYNLPLRLLSLPFYLLAERLNQTTTMTVFARLSGDSVPSIN